MVRRIIGSFLILLSLSIPAYMLCCVWIDAYQYNRDVKSYWLLAEKASTIAQKSEYIDQFVARLEGGKLAGVCGPLFLNTPDNCFDDNFKVLKSLQERLHKIGGMDENSVAYQAAMQQITEQEQNQADAMLRVFWRSWEQVHCYWCQHIFITVGFYIIAFIAAFAGDRLLRAKKAVNKCE